MLLNSSNRVFSVFQTLRSYKEVTVYLAKDAEHSTSYFLINEICCPNCIRSNIKAMLTLQNKKNFSEFVEMFTLDSKLYLVFKYTKPHLILNYLGKNKLSFIDKLKLLENYLFQLATYSGLPSPILHSLTDLDNINVNPDETAYFNFSLKPQHLLQSNDKNVVFNSVASFIRTLFSDDLHSSKGRQLLLILEKCDKSIYKSIPQIIKDVQNIDTTSSWDKIKQYLQERKSQVKVVKDFAMTALLVLLVVIVYTKFISPNSISVSSPNQPVTQVGDVVVIESELEEDASNPLEETYSPPPTIKVDME